MQFASFERVWEHDARCVRADLDGISAVLLGKTLQIYIFRR